MAAEDDQVSAVHEDSRVDMFFDYLAEVGTVVWRRVAAKMVPLQLI